MRAGGPDGTFVHAGIIGWTGMEARTLALAEAVAPVAGRVSVVYSHRDGRDRSGPGDWHRLEDSAFFGAKFARLLSLWDSGVLLLMHPDTACDDWPGLVRACAGCFADVKELGVWGPGLTGTPWTLPEVALSDAAPLVPVVQTDGIVAGFAPAVVDRLRRLDLSDNPLGWGIDWAAVAFSLATGRQVLRDTRVTVTHDAGRAYGDAPAKAQMDAFLAQLTPAERAQFTLARHYAITRKRAARPLASRLWAEMRGRQPFGRL